MIAKGNNSNAPPAERQNEIAIPEASSAYRIRIADAETESTPIDRIVHGTHVFSLASRLKRLDTGVAYEAMSHPQIAIGAIVINNDELLMVQRANDPGKGLWSLPGGRVEHGEYLADALRREVREETGLEVEVGELAGILEVPGTELHYVILDYHATLTGSAEPVPGSDASDVRWVPLKEVAHLECTPRFVETMMAWRVLADDE